MQELLLAQANHELTAYMEEGEKDEEEQRPQAHEDAAGAGAAAAAAAAAGGGATAASRAGVVRPGGHDPSPPSSLPWLETSVETHFRSEKAGGVLGFVEGHFFNTSASPTEAVERLSDFLRGLAQVGWWV